MTVPRTHAARAVLGSRLYVFGGLPFQAGPSRTVERYNPELDTWERLADLPTPTDHAMAVALGGDLYLFGGGYANGSTSVLRYTSATATWQQVASLPKPRAAGGAVVLDGRVYVVGGIGTDTPTGGTRDVVAYEPRAGTWTSAAPLRTPRHHHATVVYEGKVCALGGRGVRPADAFECLDVVTGAWTPMPAPLDTLDDFDAVVVGNELWAIHRYVDVFVAGSWTRRGEATGLTFGHSAAYIPPHVVVAGAEVLRWTVK